MARADMLVRLVQAGATGDDADFRRAVEALAEEERRLQHHVLADRLLRSVRVRSGRGPRLVDDPEAAGLVHEHIPERTLDELVLPDAVAEALRELVEEQERRELLRAHGLEPRHRVLLVGPPGTGKTTTAEALANELALSIITPRYEKLIGSLLGETAARIGRLFDAVASRPCVLFLDEVDTLAKERSDAQETGEIKRVVSSLLLLVDRLPSHVVVVAATNHAELLDRAVWRRFELRLTLPLPTRATRTLYFERAMASARSPWGISARTLADKLDGLSFAELEAFTLDVQRRVVLAPPTDTARDIVHRRLAQWTSRARAKE